MDVKLVFFFHVFFIFTSFDLTIFELPERYLVQLHFRLLYLLFMIRLTYRGVVSHIISVVVGPRRDHAA